MIAAVHRYHTGDIGIDLSPAALLRLAAGQGLDRIDIPLADGTRISIMRVDTLDHTRPHRAEDDRAARETVEITMPPLEAR